MDCTDSEDKSSWGLQTAMAHLGDLRPLYHGAVVPPLFQNSLFTFGSYDEADRAFANRDNSFIYTRGNNPTVVMAEEKLAFLEGGESAKLFGSGMAAISSAINRFVKQGSHVICVRSCYPVTYNYLTQFLSRFGVQTTFVDGNVSEFEDALRPNTDLIYLESPTSMIFRVLDLPRITELAKRHNVPTIIDNSWATPIFQKPLSLGVDVVVHSVSKYLGGHSDVVAGALISSKAICAQIEEFERAMGGGIIGPFEAWLVLRGLRTIGLRMTRHRESALEVAAFLDRHPKIVKVHYPGLPGSPDHAIASQQMTGFSGLFSFEVDTDVQGIKRFINGLRLFKIGVSWGGFESLVYAPIISLAREVPETEWTKSGVIPTLIRVSIGLENVEDLLVDMDNALSMV